MTISLSPSPNYKVFEWEKYTLIGLSYDITLYDNPIAS